MSLALKDGETYLSCPYDEAHRILTYRFQTHLVKCRKNYPDKKMLSCCFNSTHIVSDAEYAYHIQNCKDSYLLDRHLYLPDDAVVNKYPIKNTQVPCTESWDDEEDVPTYDPKEHCLSKPILRRLDLAPAASRRDFRNEERRRFQQFSDYQPSSSSLSSKKDELLRRPKQPSAAMTSQVSENDTTDISNMVRDLHLKHCEDDCRPPPPLSEILQSQKPTSPLSPLGVQSDGWTIKQRRGRGRGRAKFEK